MSSTSQKIFVTGATGLVGSFLVQRLVDEGKEVRALIRSEASLALFDEILKRPDLRDKIEWVYGDIEDQLSLLDVMSGVGKVYHCAAKVSFQKKDREELFKANIQGTANVVNACLEKGVEKLCFVSSVSALGRAASNVSMDENTHWEDSPYNTAYAISKYHSELEVWRGVEEGLKAVIVNPSMILGPCYWQRSTGTIFRAAWKGQKFYTDGINGFVGVWDVVDAMCKLMDSEISGERYVTVAENIDYRTLFNMIADKLGKPRPTFQIKPWMMDLGWRVEALRSSLIGTEPILTKETAKTASNKYFYSSEKIKKQLGFSFEPIGNVISKTAEAFRQSYH